MQSRARERGADFVKQFEDFWSNIYLVMRVTFLMMIYVERWLLIIHKCFEDMP